MALRQDCERPAHKPPRQGVCADCLWVCGPLRDGCDHEQVSGNVRPWRVPTAKARREGAACGPQARLWEALP